VVSRKTLVHPAIHLSVLVRRTWANRSLREPIRLPASWAPKPPAVSRQNQSDQRLTGQLKYMSIKLQPMQPNLFRHLAKPYPESTRRRRGQLEEMISCVLPRGAAHSREAGGCVDGVYRGRFAGFERPAKAIFAVVRRDDKWPRPH